MKAISIGYSTENNDLFFERIQDLKKHPNLYSIKDDIDNGLNGSTEQLLQDLDREFNQYMTNFKDEPGFDKMMAKWNQKLTNFKAVTLHREGVALSWSVEYDNNVLFVYDTTLEQLQALNVPE